MAVFRSSFSSFCLSSSRLSSTVTSPPLLCLTVCALVLSIFSAQLLMAQSASVEPPLNLNDAVGVGANWLLANVPEADHTPSFCEVEHAAKFEVCLRLKTLFLDTVWKPACVLYLFENCIDQVSRQLCPLQAHDLKVSMWKFLIEELGTDFSSYGSPSYSQCIPGHLFGQFVFAFIFFIVSFLVLFFWGPFTGFLNGTPSDQQLPTAPPLEVVALPPNSIELQHLMCATTPPVQLPHHPHHPCPPYPHSLTDEPFSTESAAKVVDKKLEEVETQKTKDFVPKKAKRKRRKEKVAADVSVSGNDDFFSSGSLLPSAPSPDSDSTLASPSSLYANLGNQARFVEQDNYTVN